MMETSTRSARNRRVVAILGWGILVGTAMILWNGRLQESIRSVGDEPVAFLLATFSAFVGVFAWLLFNPGRRAASESPVLFFAAAATLFPPPIIGFCLMPVDSPLRGWLAFALFLLCVIAVLSHVPDDFFGIPRGRSSYMTPLPTFDSVDDHIMNPKAAWFTFEDLTRILPDTERPSLAPRSYLQQDVSRTAPSHVRGQDKVATDVDDILGSDFDLGLLDEDLTDFDQLSSNQSTRQAPKSGRIQNNPIIDRQQANPGQKNRNATRFRESTDRQHRREEDSQQLTKESVFESFEQSSNSTRTNSLAPYSAASGNLKTLAQRRQKSQSGGFILPARVTAGTAPASDSGAATADAIRSQLAGKERISASRKSGTGLAPSSRQAFRNQPADSTSTKSTNSSADTETEYGTRDVHRGQQSRDVRQKERQSESTGTSRQQAQTKDQPSKESGVVSEPESRDQTPENSSRSERVSRFERRQKAADRNTKQPDQSEASSTQADRKLVRKADRQGSNTDTTADSTDLKSRDDSKPKRRSALDIATTGILGASAAAGITAADSSSAQSTTDSDASTSQGLFGSVRDLFQKSKSSDEETSQLADAGADEFESAVEAVQPERSSPERSSDKDVVTERTIDASGAEMVEGVAVVQFERGQKKANIHIPFSPPLQGVPEVDVECVGGESLRLKVPTPQPFGMRIEARRSNTSEAMEAEIAFAAIAEPEE